MNFKQFFFSTVHTICFCILCNQRRTGSGPVVQYLFLFLSVSDPSNRSDDGAFDIITEEEVNGVYDSDTTSQTTGGSLEGERDRRPLGAMDL